MNVSFEEHCSNLECTTFSKSSDQWAFALWLCRARWLI